MKILVVDGENYAKVAVDLVIERVRAEPSGLFGFATGTTTPPVHELLARRLTESGTDASKLAVFNVDDYLDVAPDNPKTCLARMRAQLYDRIHPGRILAFRSDAADPEAEALRVRDGIERAGGIALQMLGIGSDGHIGFNDPGTPWESEVAVVSFSEKSRAGKAAAWGGAENVPARGLTLGIRGIMNARSLVLLARGEGKAEIVRAALVAPITPQVPASVLQLHPFLTVVLDSAAAAKLGK